jgi:hypothetical protein
VKSGIIGGMKKQEYLKAKLMSLQQTRTSEA